jgi:hypothetical protein
MIPSTNLQTAREAYEDALFSGCDATITIPLGRELARLEDEADPALKARRLRTKAADLEAEGERHMAAEADAAGRAASRRLRGNDDAFAASFDREAANCLALANECFAEASALEREADRINGFVIALDGVSVRRSEQRVG